MANSSMLVLPRMTTSASRSSRVTVESYGGRQPSRIFEPQVVGMPRWASTSLSASGTPASGPSLSPAARLASTAAAAARAPSVSTWRNAWTPESTAAMRSRCACATSTAVASPELIAVAVAAASRRIRSVATPLLLVQDARNAEAAVLGRRRHGQHLVAVDTGAQHVGAGDVGQPDRVGGRRDVLGGDLAHLRDGREDHVELTGVAVELVLGQLQPGKASQMCDVVAGDG